MYEVCTVLAIILLAAAGVEWLSRVKGRTELHNKLNAKREQHEREKPWQ